jgi:hypothetical protein
MLKPPMYLDVRSCDVRGRDDEQSEAEKEREREKQREATRETDRIAHLRRLLKQRRQHKK